jgi:hypothetical protein
MQQAEAHSGTKNHFELLNSEKPARELHGVLARRLPSLRRSAHRLPGNAAGAEDAVQDALLSACRHLNQFRGESKDLCLADYDYCPIQQCPYAIASPAASGRCAFIQ